MHNKILLTMVYTKHKLPTKRSVEYYLEQVNNLIEYSDIPIVIYTDIPEKFSKRKNVYIDTKNLLDIVNLDFEYKHLFDREKFISKDYETKYRTRIRHYIRHPNRVDIYLGKLFLLKECLNKYSNNVIWMDAGLIYSCICYHNYIKNVNIFKNKQKIDKFNLFLEDLVKDYDHMFFYTNDYWIFLEKDYFKKININPVQIIGGFYYINKNYFDSFHKIFIDCFKYFIDNQLPILDEEPMMMSSNHIKMNSLHINNLLDIFRKCKYPNSLNPVNFKDIKI